MPNVLLCVTGSVAAIKTNQMVAALQQHASMQANVRVVISIHAQHFISVEEWPHLGSENSKQSASADAPERPTVASPFGVSFPAITLRHSTAPPTERTTVSSIAVSSSTASTVLPTQTTVAEAFALTNRPTEDRRHLITDDHAYIFHANPNPDGSPVIVYRDEDEWGSWHQMGDEVLHIGLRAWADILVLAPLSANTLGKMANGLCDNLTTCIVRAWDTKDQRKAVVVAPAMNTMMWEHPLTGEHFKQLYTIYNSDLRRLGPVDVEGEANPETAISAPGLLLAPPQSKRLACGDMGRGAMATPSVICELVRQVYECSISPRNGNQYWGSNLQWFRTMWPTVFPVPPVVVTRSENPPTDLTPLTEDDDVLFQDGRLQPFEGRGIRLSIDHPMAIALSVHNHAPRPSTAGEGFVTYSVESTVSTKANRGRGEDDELLIGTTSDQPTDPSNAAPVRKRRLKEYERLIEKTCGAISFSERYLLPSNEQMDNNLIFNRYARLRKGDRIEVVVQGKEGDLHSGKGVVYNTPLYGGRATAVYDTLDGKSSNGAWLYIPPDDHYLVSLTVT